MNRAAPYLGALGAGALLAGAFVYFTQPTREAWWVSFLVVGLIGIGCFVVDRWSAIVTFAGGRTAREGANSGLLSIFVVGILAAINYIAVNHAKQWDLTAAKQYTLSDQSLRLLSGLERELHIVLLDIPSRAVTPRDLLALYDDESPLVSTEIIDPEAAPERALAYQNPTEPGITLGTVIIDTGERTERATAATEPEITNAILRVLNDQRKKIYFTGGHGEKALDDSDPRTGLSVMNTKLRDSLYDTDTLVLSRSRSRSLSGGDGGLVVPGDADALVVAGPRSDFDAEELRAVDTYVRGGGKAVFLVDPPSEADTPNLVTYLREQGADVGDDMVIDPGSNPAAWPLVSDYGSHPIVGSFRSVRSIFPLVRSVSRSDTPLEGVHVEELFSTHAESWAETRIEELPERQGPADDQTRGPLSLAVALTLDVETDDGIASSQASGDGDGAADGESKSARIVVVGDSDFITNEPAQAPILNADLFLNMVNWVAQDEDLMAIRPREPEDRRIFLSAQQSDNVMLLTLLVLPGIVAVTGVSVWWGRR